MGVSKIGELHVSKRIWVLIVLQWVLRWVIYGWRSSSTSICEWIVELSNVRVIRWVEGWIIAYSPKCTYTTVGSLHQLGPHLSMHNAIHMIDPYVTHLQLHINCTHKVTYSLYTSPAKSIGSSCMYTQSNYYVLGLFHRSYGEVIALVFDNNNSISWQNNLTVLVHSLVGTCPSVESCYHNILTSGIRHFSESNLYQLPCYHSGK